MDLKKSTTDRAVVFSTLATSVSVALTASRSLMFFTGSSTTGFPRTMMIPVCPAWNSTVYSLILFRESIFSGAASSPLMSVDMALRLYSETMARMRVTTMM